MVEIRACKKEIKALKIRIKANEETTALSAELTQKEKEQTTV